MNVAVYVINLKLKEKLQICMTTICTITSQVVLNTFVIWLNFVDFVMIQIMYSRKRVMVMIVLLEISRIHMTGVSTNPKKLTMKMT